jgi:hypothetical protein
MYTDLIQQRFQYLVNEHGFVVTVDGPIVEYGSDRCCVTVCVEKGGQVAVTLSSTEPQVIRRAHLYLENILLVQNTRFRFKHRWSAKKFERDPAGHIDRQLTEQARLLREQCDPILRGDFSLRTAVEELQRKRVEPLLRFLRGEARLRRPE